ncbi:hypothetical protein [Peribacillus deserti]|uniref:hypothetical protein n=1 Tax=Peribacillus deserti TaxID=673318 RepID=UPI0015E14B8E|nr:hypothetical protein [Peribacillus deserti]
MKRDVKFAERITAGVAALKVTAITADGTKSIDQGYEEFITHYSLTYTTVLNKKKASH